MEIILLERVEKLGNIGDVVTVKDGYARNFFLPNKKALRSNESNRKVFEANKERLVAENAAKRAEAEGASGNVDGKEVVLIRAASNAGQLYGSVSVRDIVEGLHEIGVTEVTKAMVVMERPIKTLGIFEVKVRLHPEVVVTVKANVARSPEESELQSQGVDVLKQMFEDEAAEDAEAAAELEEEFLEAQAEAEAADEGHAA